MCEGDLTPMFSWGCIQLTVLGGVFSQQVQLLSNRRVLQRMTDYSDLSICLPDS